MRIPPLLVFAAALVAILVAVAALAPVVAPHDPFGQNILQRLKAPSAAFWLGTDQFGRDVLSRIIYGLRASLGVSVSAVLGALLVGGSLGLAAAYYGGWVDRIVMRLMDVLFAFPVMLLAIGIIAALGPGATTTAIAIALVYTPIFARVLRGPALVLGGSDFVLAARSAGASDGRIIFHHILPNLASVVLVQTSLLLSTAILVEASLSFLGLGTQPPAPSLGMMLSEGRGFLLLSPWSAVFSGVAILVLAFGLNLLGDVMRDTLDPRLRGER
ncbi:ABC transporter permease [Salinarimonas soli]|uniref:ABC transporter permease n=1 Tax=Salinarimonas soli TaxID=1638099 RepID=A0A5B2W180_9HYPH|nr:ABC transporter permease [Salinarimonas soli]KAA2244256.1 ABC transporter permease [Salinarimonas soli]